MSGDRATVMNREEMDELYNQEQGLWGLFVAGAPGFLTVNINPAKNLANGTPIVYESITFDHSKDIDHVRLAMLQISIAQPGEVIEIDIVSKTINVCVPNVDPKTWPADQSLVQGRVVIPIYRNSSVTPLKVKPSVDFYFLEKSTSINTQSISDLR